MPSCRSSLQGLAITSVPRGIEIGVNQPLLCITTVVVCVYLTAMCACKSWSPGIEQTGADESAPPAVLHRAPAECTDEARLAHVRASIELAGTIGVDGGVSGAKVLRGAGFGLDESALAAFSQWKFRPARQGGHPVETKVVVVIPFRCSADALAARMILELPPGASRPVLRKGDVGLLGSVFGGQSLMLEITEIGTVASDAALPDAARALLAGWRFDPARLHGRPLRVRGVLEWGHWR